MAVAEQVTSLRWRRLDKVWTASGLLLLAVLILDPGQFQNSIFFLGESWVWTAPFILFSCALSASIAATALDKPLAEVLRRRAMVAVLLAGVFGALSPFCSVSVVPL
ncbi:MAG: permease, partial [Rhodospirillaceae bacterium]|nr:permease [Rhodospirillaceae bacterium]